MKLNCGISNEYFVINDAERLDPVTVILKDNEDKTGKIIVECYGEAWSTYFGGVWDNHTFRSFLSKLDVEYLGERLISRAFHRPPKREVEYVYRIASAIIDSCKMLEGS